MTRLDHKAESVRLGIAMTRAYTESYRSCFTEETMIHLELCCKSNDWKSLAKSSDFVPRGTYEWTHLRQIEAFFKKNSDLADDSLCVANATAAFHEAEKLCRIANKRLDHYGRNPNRVDADMAVYIRRVQKLIASVLGPILQFHEELPKRVRMTDGAAYSRPRKRSLSHLKISGRMEVPTIGAVRYLTTMARYFGHDNQQAKIVSKNRIVFVLKNWQTHRTIAAEPEGATPFQLSFDSYVKDRLLPYGIDLRHGQSVHQSAACKASLDGEDATVDMKQASDSTALNAVHLLFPHEWAEFLRKFRCEEYTGEIGNGTYAKFSSMGNGSTFVIETLIFWAAARAVGARKALVYGDDVIIPVDLVPEYVRFLKFLGFRINTEKTFTEGNFRESCGGDYFFGRLVTPFYFRRYPRSRRDWSHIVNGLNGLAYSDSSLEKLAASFLVAEELRLVPFNDDSGSGVFIPPGEAYSRKLIKVKDSVGSFSAYSVIPKTKPTWGWRSALLWHLSALSGERRRNGFQEPGMSPVIFDVPQSSTVTGVRMTVSPRVYAPSSPCPIHVYELMPAMIAAHALVMRNVMKRRRSTSRNAKKGRVRTR
jgi:hypothetical protein